MRILVCGTRKAFSREEVFVGLHAQLPLSFPMTVMHGNCEGVDRWAGEWGNQYADGTGAYPVDPKLDGPWPAAGPRRNARMVEQGKPDLCVAFWDGRSKGTLSTISECARRGIPVRIVGKV